MPPWHSSVADLVGIITALGNMQKMLHFMQRTPKLQSAKGLGDSQHYSQATVSKSQKKITHSLGKQDKRLMLTFSCHVSMADSQQSLPAICYRIRNQILEISMTNSWNINFGTKLYIV